MLLFFNNLKQKATTFTNNTNKIDRLVIKKKKQNARRMVSRLALFR